MITLPGDAGQQEVLPAGKEGVQRIGPIQGRKGALAAYQRFKLAVVQAQDGDVLTIGVLIRAFQADAHVLSGLGDGADHFAVAIDIAGGKTHGAVFFHPGEIGIIRGAGR